ncbi:MULTISPECIES: NADH-quinone oxidoreductase subunit A [unclassified Streptomyces]|uniref:NADH-quinone oxidoreductase subunit A n=1 Tax=unclassified Streptomyces TaxID=2593676 RepID=UPI001904B17A|nr:NADH-quinone oxidoreductase subunit A [Streptomyces sp. HSG2]
MDAWRPILVLLGVVGAGILLLHGLGRWLAVDREPLRTTPFVGGHAPVDHAFCRYHVRWYPVAMMFLAFDMEMLFMYPWVTVVSEVGTAAVVEMFLFLAILFAGVTYAWREGALRWA